MRPFPIDFDPACFVRLLSPVHVEAVTAGVAVLMAAMPAGATTSILAVKYNADANFAVRLVIFTTMASLLTTPVWSYILTL